MAELSPPEKEELEKILTTFEDAKRSSATNLESLFNLRLHLLQKYGSRVTFEELSPKRGIYIQHHHHFRTVLFVAGNYAGIAKTGEPEYSVSEDSEPCTFYRSALKPGEVYCPRQSSHEFVVVANELESAPSDDKLVHYLFLALARSELVKKE